MHRTTRTRRRRKTLGKSKLSVLVVFFAAVPMRIVLGRLQKPTVQTDWKKLHGGAKLPPQHFCTMVCQKHSWVQ